MQASIAYFVTELENFDSIVNWTLAGIRRYAAARGWNAVPWSDATPGGLASLRSLHGPIAGCIVECSNGNNTRSPAMFGKMPLVYMNAPQSLYKEALRHVGVDNAAVAAAAFRELSAGNPRAFAFVGDSRNLMWNKARKRAFSAIVANAGANCVIFPHVADAEKRAGCLTAWLEKLPSRTAVFAANDFAAKDVVAAAMSAGRAIPGEITLLGVDNNPSVCKSATPPLSSIQLDFERMGFVAARAIGDALAAKHAKRRKGIEESASFGAEKGSVTIGPLLAVRRESTGGVGRREPHVLAAIELIRREACDGLDARDVIARSPGSKSLFNLRFREATGHSVHNEIEHVRLEKAFALLSDTDTAIGAIADMCGYRSNIALHKAFRLQTGMSMSAWRAQNRC